MKKLNTVVSLLTVAGAAALPLSANADGWKGEVSAGALVTSGNSETSTLNGKFVVGYDSGAWTHAFSATALGASNTDDATGVEATTAERYTAGYKSTYSFTDFDYLFGSLEYEKDRFSGVREKTAETVGYGRRLINTKVHKLDAEIGAGARQLEFQPDATGFVQKENEFITHLGANYTWNISDTSTFIQTLKIDSGESNTSTESVSELKLSIIGNLFASLSFTARNNSDVPAGTDKTDTATAINLSYGFGKK